jgi:hypothetical protein
LNLPSNHIPAWVDKDRLAVEISGTPKTVDNWVRQGLLPPGERRGGKTLWQWRMVELWLERGGNPGQGSLDPDADAVMEATKRALARRAKG